MNKQERDRLREKYEGVRGSAIATLVFSLLDHIDALEGQIESAYREGFEDGIASESYSVSAHWAGSDAKAALTQAEEKGNG